MSTTTRVHPFLLDATLEAAVRLARRVAGAEGALVASVTDGEATVVSVCADPPQLHALLGSRRPWQPRPGDALEQAFDLGPGLPRVVWAVEVYDQGTVVGVLALLGGDIEWTGERTASLDDLAAGIGAHLGLARRLAVRDADLNVVQQSYQGLVEQIPAVTYVCEAGPGAHHLYISPQIEAWTGYPASRWTEVKGWWLDVVHPEDRDRVRAEVARTYATDEDFDLQYRIVTVDGRVLLVWDRETMIRDPDGAPILSQGIMIDVTGSAQTETDLALSQARLDAVVHSSPLVLFSIDARGRLTVIGGNAAKALGLSPENNVGDHYSQAFYRYPDLCRRIDGALMGRRGQIDVRVDDVAFEVTVEPVMRDGSVASVTGVVVDVTTRWRSQQQLARLAARDPLTGLLNRTGLQQEALRITAAGGPARRWALLYIDLDDFKSVNDAFGHLAGDRLLLDVARALRDSVPREAAVARHGGDEFIVLAPVDPDDIRPGTAAVEAVRRALARPITVEDHPIRVQASIGVALWPDHGDDLLDLLRYADVALYESKRLGQGLAEWYETEDTHDPGRRTRSHRFREAMANDGLELYFQPIVDLKTGDAVGVEALLRWDDPVVGQVAPREVMALAEWLGMGPRLDTWILRRACEQARIMAEAGIEGYVSVNATARQLGAADVVETVTEELRRSGVQPARLVLEVTEDTVVGDATVLSALRRLRELGIRVAVDDFGAGYSALMTSHGLPADLLKIDRSFVAVLGTSPAADAVLSSFLHLAGRLGMTAIAVGVETAEQRAALEAAGCDAAQGYEIARPLDSEHVVAWLADLADRIAAGT